MLCLMLCYNPSLGICVCETTIISRCCNSAQGWMDDYGAWKPLLPGRQGCDGDGRECRRRCPAVASRTEHVRRPNRYRISNVLFLAMKKALAISYADLTSQPCH